MPEVKSVIKPTQHRLFGTDGVRGRAGSEPITGATMLRVAMAMASRCDIGVQHYRAVVGRDTRLSGPMLESAMAAGLAAMGIDVALVGVVPTPAVAFLTRSLRADLGIMISASHNPYYDNGIKVFGPDGYKLSDAVETEIEHAMGEPQRGATSDRIGRMHSLNDAEGRYIEAIKATLPRLMRLDGMRVVVDCANGAAWRIAPAVLHELGAHVIPIAAEPDGININAGCGAAHPQALASAVIHYQADVGIALDGDADRVVLCDEKGALIDGDQILGVIAADWHSEDRIRGGTVVATVMSNLGLDRHLESLGLQVCNASVGDRYVLDMMLELGCNLGGEQSGHVILSDYATTGDGLLTALQVLAAVVKVQRPVSEAARCFMPIPQRIHNMPMLDPGLGPVLLARDDVQTAISAARDRLGRRGRLLVRKSGTEPIIRVMAESEDAALVDGTIDAICAAVSRAEAAFHRASVWESS